MSIYMARINGGKSFTLYDEDGSGVVNDIYQAFEHIGAIQRFLNERIDIESFDAGTIIVCLTEVQVHRLSLKVPVEEKIRATDDLAKEKFRQLYQIIDKLNN